MDGYLCTIAEEYVDTISCEIEDTYAFFEVIWESYDTTAYSASAKLFVYDYCSDYLNKTS
jgi:hypothetical protein